MSEEKTIKRPLDLDEIRARLAGKTGPRYWRGLDELAQTEEFQDILKHEFPENADQFAESGVSRRRFFQLMSASFALAGLAGCDVFHQPPEKIVPYIEQPEILVPGKPLYYASVLDWRGYGRGVVVESHMGRPTKIEGNSLHPGSLGSSDAFTQAEILHCWDPERANVLTHSGGISTWDEFARALNALLIEATFDQGSGVRLLTGPVTSPALAAQIAEFLGKYPKAKWHRYEAVTRDNTRQAIRKVFGTDLNCYYKFDMADVVLSLDDDFFSNQPASVRYARDFSTRRRVTGDKANLNRVYAVETMPGLVGAIADHKMPLRPAEIESFARLVAGQLGVNAGTPGTLPAEAQKLAAAAAKDLRAHRGSGVVTAGESQPPAVHAIAHLCNQALGNTGTTVIYTDPVEASPELDLPSFTQLCQEMEAGQVSLLLMIGGNPVFTAPADLDFGARLKKVKTSIYLGMNENETSQWCQWMIPRTHTLETWGDRRAFDGTISIQQPLISPLYNGKSEYELLSAFLGAPDKKAHDIVKDHWRAQKSSLASKAFDDWWQTTVCNGVMEGTALPAKSVTARANADLGPAPAVSSGMDLVFRPDPTLWDGEYANNGWMQELPKPLTKLTWDNAALMSPTTAKSMGLQVEDLVELSTPDGKVKMPVWIQPGHADNCVTVHFGYGRTRVGKVGEGAGFNVYPLRTTRGLWYQGGLSVARASGTYRLAVTHTHNSMEGRGLVRAATLTRFQQKPDFVRDEDESPPEGLTLYPGFPKEGYQWGMAIDLSTCIGCNACVVACQSENNIPVVGKDQVLRGREMHWIRVDRYYEGGLDNPRTYHEPIPCMHCEQAPCEVVCPVGATVHSSDGLNEMVYNRCIGTRYCSNNCPYKVRRFNFLQYSDPKTPAVRLRSNPNVTIRNRGVMEKCSYCIQRIEFARIESQKQERPIADGEILTACQQACPAQAIIFGDIANSATQVSKLRATPLNYGILTELNTRPRTTYLGKVWNPNPEIGAE